jgi:hypothetical protein
MFENEDLEDIDISPEEDLIIIIHKGGEFSVIPPDNNDVSYAQIELLEQALVALRPSIFLLVFLKIEIGLIRVWEYLFKKEDP